jgi:hypothetical protein
MLLKCANLQIARHPTYGWSAISPSGNPEKWVPTWEQFLAAGALSGWAYTVTTLRHDASTISAMLGKLSEVR